MTVDENSNISEWNIQEYDYDGEFTGHEYPQRTVESGESSGLHLSLIINESNFDYLCRGKYDQGKYFSRYLNTRLI